MRSLIHGVKFTVLPNCPDLDKFGGFLTNIITSHVFEFEYYDERKQAKHYFI